MQNRRRNHVTILYQEATRKRGPTKAPVDVFDARSLIETDPIWKILTSLNRSLGPTAVQIFSFSKRTLSQQPEIYIGYIIMSFIEYLFTASNRMVQSRSSFKSAGVYLLAVPKYKSSSMYILSNQ